MAVVITGAAKNIGKGISELLVKNGYDCVLLDIDGDALEKLKTKLPEAKTYHIDIANTKSIDEFINWLEQNNVQVDVLVNNVGLEKEEGLLELTPEIIESSNNTNLTGPFYLTSQISRRMKKGSIVFISSTHSTVIRTHPLYSASKAAIEMFMKESAIELAQNNIRVNAIAPGPVIDSEEPEASKYIPLGFALQPKDIAESLFFLVSDSARYITGQTLIVDGGFSLTDTHYWIKKKDL